MDKERKRLVLDHIFGLLTLEQVGEALGVGPQRAYQLKQKLWRDYRVPEAYQRDGQACAHWVAMQDQREWPCGRQVMTPKLHYFNERFEDYKEW